MRYRHKLTGNLLVHLQYLGIESVNGIASAAMYYNCDLDGLVVIADEDAKNLLLPVSTKCPIDVYRILHEKISKQIAIELSEIIEAKIVNEVLKRENA